MLVNYLFSFCILKLSQNLLKDILHKVKLTKTIKNVIWISSEKGLGPVLQYRGFLHISEQTVLMSEWNFGMETNRVNLLLCVNFLGQPIGSVWKCKKTALVLERTSCSRSVPSPGISKRTFHMAAIKYVRFVKCSPVTVTYGFAGRQVKSQKVACTRTGLGLIPLFTET